MLYKGKTAIVGTPREVFSQADRLEEMGLAAPQITYVFSKLKKMGYFLEKNEFFMQFLEKNILKKKNDRIYLNPNYYAVSDFIIEHLLP